MRALLILLLVLTVKIGQSQILIAMLFGDKLNSGKLEFGVSLGNNFSTVLNYPGGEWKVRGFDFGLFFNITLKKGFFLHVAAIPKNTQGLRSMPLYPSGNQFIDAATDSLDFNLERKVSYIHVPILARYVFSEKVKIFFETGPLITLRTKAWDIYTQDDDNGETEYKKDIKDTVRRFDFGLAAGVGYKFKKGMEVTVRYNQGFLDTDKDDATGLQRNTSLMLNVNIAVGAGKKKAAATAAPQEQTQPAEKPAKEKKQKTKKKKD